MLFSRNSVILGNFLIIFFRSQIIDIFPHITYRTAAVAQIPCNCMGFPTPGIRPNSLPCWNSTLISILYSLIFFYIDFKIGDCNCLGFPAPAPGICPNSLLCWNSKLISILYLLIFILILISKLGIDTLQLPGVPSPRNLNLFSALLQFQTDINFRY